MWQELEKRPWKKEQGQDWPKKKTHVQPKGQEVLPTPVYPSQWISKIAIPDGWTTVIHDTELRLCQISSQALLSVSPLAVTRSIVVKADYSWILHVNNHHVDPQNISLLVEVPPILDADSTASLLQTVCKLNTCAGNPDPKFINLAKSKKNGQFLSNKKEVVAYLDSGFCVLVDGQQYVSTVRCSNCQLLTDHVRCTYCVVYRSTLISMCYRLESTIPVLQVKKQTTGMF